MAATAAPRDKIFQFAPTPVLVRDVLGREAFNQTLCELILAARERVPGHQPSNRGDWQSPPNFLETLPADVQNSLAELVTGCIRDVLALLGVQPQGYKYRISGWANVTEQSSFNVPHSHHNSVWSAIYYLAGDKDAGGELHVMDPRPQVTVIKNAISPGGSELVYKPEPSSIIVFPAWLAHFVTPYSGQTPRINVAFNVA